MGQQFESHRAWVFSCDLFHESDKTPWTADPPWSTRAQQALQFVLSQAQPQPQDVMIMFDGRSRACRRQLEKALDEGTQANVTEMHIHYK